MPFMKVGEFQEWTNAFARKTIHWDDEKCLLEHEKELLAGECRYLPDHSKRCCGNSPNKSHLASICYADRDPADFYRHKPAEPKVARHAQTIDKVQRENKHLKYSIWKHRMNTLPVESSPYRLNIKTRKRSERRKKRKLIIKKHGKGSAKLVLSAEQQAEMESLLKQMKITLAKARAGPN